MNRRTGLVLVFSLVAVILHIANPSVLSPWLAVTLALSPYWILPALGIIVFSMSVVTLLGGYIIFAMLWLLGVDTGRNKITK